MVTVEGSDQKFTVVCKWTSTMSSSTVMLPSSSIFSADLQPCKTCSGPMLAHRYEPKAMRLIVSAHLHTGVHSLCLCFAPGATLNYWVKSQRSASSLQYR